MSLENHVTKDTPPCFLWQTVTDQTVPVENSYLFAQACAQAGVPFAQHVFSEGIHGLSVATEEWLEQNIGQEEGKRYTQETWRCIFCYMIFQRHIVQFLL